MLHLHRHCLVELARRSIAVQPGWPMTSISSSATTRYRSCSDWPGFGRDLSTVPRLRPQAGHPLLWPTRRLGRRWPTDGGLSGPAGQGVDAEGPRRPEVRGVDRDQFDAGAAGRGALAGEGDRERYEQLLAVARGHRGAGFRVGVGGRLVARPYCRGRGAGAGVEDLKAVGGCDVGVGVVQRERQGLDERPDHADAAASGGLGQRGALGGERLRRSRCRTARHGPEPRPGGGGPAGRRAGRRSFRRRRRWA